jgi:hypothetical protein
MTYPKFFAKSISALLVLIGLLVFAFDRSIDGFIFLAMPFLIMALIIALIQYKRDYLKLKYLWELDDAIHRVIDVHFEISCGNFMRFISILRPQKALLVLTPDTFYILTYIDIFNLLRNYSNYFVIQNKVWHLSIYDAKTNLPEGKIKDIEFSNGNTILKLNATEDSGRNSNCDFIIYHDLKELIETKTDFLRR